MTHDRTDGRSGNDRGVSPVIGAILMVAITVVMAAAIGTFVLDMGGSAGETAPQAALDVAVDAGADEVTVSHRGGGGIEATRTRLVLTDEAGGSRLTFGPSRNSSVLRVGDVVTLDAAGANVTSPRWGDMPAVGGGFPLQAGGRYTLQVIDTESQRVVFETTATA